MKQLCIIGAGGHGKVVAEIAELQNKYDAIFFLDDANVEWCGEYRVVGTVSEYIKHVKTCDFVVAIGNNENRKKIIEQLLKANAVFPTLIHPCSTVSKSAKIELGCVVMAGAIVNADARIGRGTILNTCCSVDHDNNIGKYCHISVGAHLAGTVEVGDCAFIGAGATVKNNVTICTNAIVGAGAVVLRDITESGTYIGVPAKKMKA
ncbi:MAG: acetyltransferase [Clostridia bacterium]|nr:acetyltransferase [Clostridia bacterium]